MATGKQALGVIAIAMAQAAGAAIAQTYPVKAVRLIVPFPPGGSTETLGRLVGVKLSELWGQPFIVDNRPGASGIIGTELGAKAAPDGYTLLMGSAGPLTILPGLQGKLPYDSLKDFAPIVNVAALPNVYALHPSVPARDIKSLIALARARPGQLAFSSNGSGTPGHLAGELLKSMAGINLLHVPYKGAAPGTMAVLSGEVSMTVTTPTAVLPQVKAGRLKIIAVTSLQRLPQLPDIPTVAESGLAGYEAISWFGLVAPAALPAELLKKIGSDALQVLGQREVRERVTALGATLIANTPEQYRAQIRDDLAKWARVISQSGAKPE